MKIAMMTNNYLPYIGGVPISIQRLSDGLRSLGHEVVVFAPTYQEQQETHHTVRYHSLIKGIVNGASVPNSFDRRIEEAFVRGGFDVIHVHHPMMIGWTAVYLSRKYNVPLVLTYHTRYEQYLHYIKASYFQKLVPFYMKHYMKFCDMVFAPTPLMQDYLYEIGCTVPVRVLPTGISNNSFYVDEEAAPALRGKFLGDEDNNTWECRYFKEDSENHNDIQEGKCFKEDSNKHIWEHFGDERNRQAYKRKYLFCTVARLAKEKNLEFLFRVLAERKKANGEADFRFVLVGEGPEERHLKKLAVKLNLKDEIYFVGRVPNEEIKNYCRASDLFLFSSCSETQGIVLLEAMAAGTPVVAVRATGVCDIVMDGVNGYMTDASEAAFAKTLDAVLQNPRGHLREGALNTARSFRICDIAKCAVSYYQTAIANHAYTDAIITRDFLLHKISGIL